MCSGALLDSHDWPWIEGSYRTPCDFQPRNLSQQTSIFAKITLSPSSMQTFLPSHGAVCQTRTAKTSSSKHAQSFSKAQNVCKFLTLRTPHLTIVVQSQEVQLVVQPVGDVPRVHISTDDGSRHVKRTPWPQDGRQVGDPYHRFIPVREGRQ